MTPPRKDPPTMSKHAAVWLDHREARIFHIDPEHVDEETLKAHRPVHHQHPLGPDGAKAHPEDDRKFFHGIARALDTAMDILIVGPSTAKLQFIRHVHRFEHALEPKIVGVETVDHPTDGQIVAYAIKYFKRTDNLR
jgi:stalled ribosome rescue protein Dom34